jgi:PilZ domain-containing protein
MDSRTIRRTRLLQGLSPDRRGSIRFPLNLEVRYSVIGHRGPAENGSGRTIDLSISGLSFTADKPLSIGQRLDLSIEWPVVLDGGVQLQLVTSGVVVRSAGAVIALRIGRHEFKTRRGQLKAEPRQASVG